MMASKALPSAWDSQPWFSTQQAPGRLLPFFQVLPQMSPPRRDCARPPWLMLEMPPPPPPITLTASYFVFHVTRYHLKLSFPRTVCTCSRSAFLLLTISSTRTESSLTLCPALPWHLDSTWHTVKLKKCLLCEDLEALPRGGAI